MHLVILIAMLAYLIGGVAYGLYFAFTAKLLVQLGICLFGAVILGTLYGIDFIKNYKPKKKKEMNNNTDFSSVFNCNDKAVIDFQALHYLKDRATEIRSPEALKLVVELNNLLFSTTCPVHENQNEDKE